MLIKENNGESSHIWLSWEIQSIMKAWTAIGLAGAATWANIMLIVTCQAWHMLDEKYYYTWHASSDPK